MRKLLNAVREWLEETHSAGFELSRHFVLRFFESELISTPGQMRVVAGSAAGILFSLSFAFTQSYYRKYLELNRLPDGEPYRLALLADILFLVTLSMIVMGLFTTLQWPSLFPGLRDYLTLAALPVRMRQIFAAKFVALLAAAAGVALATALLPSMVLPMVAAGDWAVNIPLQFPGILLSASSGAAFVFFTLVAVQGILLNVLPVRQFSRVSLAIQGVLLTALLGSLSAVFSIPSLYRSMNLRPAWALWTPPIWFLGLDQIIVGNPDPFAVRLAWRAGAFVALSCAAALLSYLWSYRRHRRRVLEAPAVENAASRAVSEIIAEQVFSSGPKLATFSFISKTLSRSRQHRLILTAFVAIALAMIFEGFLTLLYTSGATRQPPGLRQAVIAVPLALSLFVLGGLRYLFRLPVELRANWLFRIHEPGRAQELLGGMEAFLFYCALAPIAMSSLPIEIAALGPMKGSLSAVLCALPAMILIEALLFAFERLPFTSSYLPGRRPLLETLLGYGVFAAAYVWGLSALIGVSLNNLGTTAATALILLAAWWAVRSARLDWQPIGRLEFEELPDAVVQTLDIEND
jgi:hypothetical protein